MLPGEPHQCPSDKWHHLSVVVQVGFCHLEAERPKQGSRTNATLESHIPLGGCYSFNAALPCEPGKTPRSMGQGGGESGLEVAF